MPELVPITSGFAGDLVSSDYIRSKFGLTNVAAVTNKEGGATEDSVSMELAIKWAEAWMYAFFGTKYARPWVVTGTVDPMIVDWAAELAYGRWCYMARGMRDDQAGGDFAKIVLNVKREMASYNIQGIGRNLPGVALSGAMTTPASIAPARDPTGNRNNTSVQRLPWARPYGWGWW